MTIFANMIVIWSGAIGTIPDGWVLCNGANGTPDLREQFVLGAGAASPPDTTGGNVNHTHTFTGDGHNHQLDAGAGMSAGAVQGKTTSTNQVTGTTDATDGRPPWYALAYIMKT